MNDFDGSFNDTRISTGGGVNVGSFFWIRHGQDFYFHDSVTDSGSMEIMDADSADEEPRTARVCVCVKVMAHVAGGAS